MIFTADKHDLLEGLNIVQKAVATKTTVPILLGIHIRTISDNQVKLTSNDNKMSIECFVDAKIAEQGEAVISARELVETVRKLEEGDLTLSVDTASFSGILKSCNFTMNIMGFDPQGYPSSDRLDNEDILEIKQNELKKMISKTVFAASDDESRPFLTGVLMKIDEKMNMVATDGHRLALMVNENISNKDMNIIVPDKVLSDIEKILKDDESPITIQWNNKHIAFNFNNVIFISRLIEGKYPDYRALIPNSYKLQIKVDKHDFKSVLERASLLAREGSNIVKLSVEPNLLKITSKVADKGNTYEELSCEASGEEFFDICFNYKYLLEAMNNAIEDDEIILKLSGDIKPGIIEGNDDPLYTHVIMPIRSR